MRIDSDGDRVLDRVIVVKDILFDDLTGELFDQSLITHDDGMPADEPMLDLTALLGDQSILETTLL